MTEAYQQAYDEGFEAYYEGYTQEDNPHECEFAERWSEGMSHAERMGDDGDYDEFKAP